MVGVVFANKMAAFLAAGLLGVAALGLGLAWDAFLHAQDPTLAQREGIFTLVNPGHVLIGAGILLADVGLVGAAYTYLPLGSWGRRGFLAGALALMVFTGVRVASTASVERSQHVADSSAHVHSPTASSGSVTAEQLQAAARLVAQTRAAVAQYGDQRVAVRAGYQPMEPPGGEIVHFVNRAYFTDADILKPDHVQSLIYYNGANGPVLIGAMYIMPKLGMPGPQIGGPLTNWHHHDNLCFDNTSHVVVAFVGDPFFDQADKSHACPRGSSKKLTPEMLHVWLVDNPNGPFDSDMEPDFLRTIIPSVAAG
jgi:hypothetical protein